MDVDWLIEDAFETVSLVTDKFGLLILRSSMCRKRLVIALGLMAPSNKKAKKDKWSEEETLALCEFLNIYVTDHGRNVQFKWVEIQPKFATLFKRTFVSEKALKNKFDGMKREYNLWTLLKNGETGLG
ncbi:myb/SANT-like domain-containing protein [Artemisia annua]|uniref:Myb/SANT-like domain-containing protein n=1 Tax=Artemisia annua TaxID=35608 RepID=A0A2U1MSA3_ARTAN|nr:myb/SANT-like domain-containing protein [Artemisia annua]